MYLLMSCSSSWSECGCCSCQRAARGRAGPSPFYPTMGQPMVYYSKVQPCCDESGRIRRSRDDKPNCFIKAFRWYTQERGPQRSDSPDEPRFATWLDTKYEQFLRDRDPDIVRLKMTQTSVVEAELVRECDFSTRLECETGPFPKKKKWRRKQRRSKMEADVQDLDSKSVLYIMEPREMPRRASDCCHHTPTSACYSETAHDKNGDAKSRSTTNVNNHSITTKVDKRTIQEVTIPATSKVTPEKSISIEMMVIDSFVKKETRDQSTQCELEQVKDDAKGQNKHLDAKPPCCDPNKPDLISPKEHVQSEYESLNKEPPGCDSNKPALISPKKSENKNAQSEYESIPINRKPPCCDSNTPHSDFLLGQQIGDNKLSKNASPAVSKTSESKQSSKNTLKPITVTCECYDDIKALKGRTPQKQMSKVDSRPLKGPPHITHESTGEKTSCCVQCKCPVYYVPSCSVPYCDNRIIVEPSKTTPRQGSISTTRSSYQGCGTTCPSKAQGLVPSSQREAVTTVVQNLSSSTRSYSTLVNDAAQTSDYSISLEPENIPGYPLFLKIMCVDKLLK